MAFLAPALPAIGAGAAELAGQLGLGAAASYAIDKTVKKGVPAFLKATKKITKNSKYKPIRKINRLLEKADTAYNSKYGKVGQEVASTVGGLAAFGAAGKALRGVQGAARAVRGAMPYARAYAGRATRSISNAAGRASRAIRNIGKTESAADKLVISQQQARQAQQSFRNAGQKFPKTKATLQAKGEVPASKVFGPPNTKEVIAGMRPETQAKYAKAQAQARAAARAAERRSKLKSYVPSQEYVNQGGAFDF